MISIRAVKKLILVIVLINLELFVRSANADGARAFKMRFAGGFIQNIEQAQVTSGVPNGNTELRSLALVKGRGTFGRADIMAVSVSGPPESDKACSPGLIKIADIVENNLVLTFADLSLLYGNGTGVVCFDPANPTAFPLAEIEGTWDGGTGRFEGASGEWTIGFDFAEAVGPGAGPDTQFVAESGLIEGFLTRGRRRD
jgi:hypothetical protein